MTTLGLDLEKLTLDELASLREAVQTEIVHRIGWARCQVCRGAGMLDDGSYCFCQLGRDLQRVERGRFST